MTTNAFLGINTSFERLEGSVWTSIAEVNSIGGIEVTRDTVEATTLDSEGGYREYIAGLRDGGSPSLNMNFTAEGYDLLKSDIESDAAVSYRVVLPDDVYSFTFSAFVTALSLGEVVPDDRVQADCTFKITGIIDTPSV